MIIILSANLTFMFWIIHLVFITVDQNFSEPNVTFSSHSQKDLFYCKTEKMGQFSQMRTFN